MNNIKLVKNILSLNFKGILNKFSILPLQCGSLGSLLLLKVVSQSVVRRAVRTFFTFCRHRRISESPKDS